MRLIKIVESKKFNFRLTDLQLNKLTSADKNQKEVTLKVTINMFSGNNLRQELLLTTTQETKLRNVFEGNM